MIREFLKHILGWNDVHLLEEIDAFSILNILYKKYWMFQKKFKVSIKNWCLGDRHSMRKRTQLPVFVKIFLHIDTLINAMIYIFQIMVIVFFFSFLFYISCSCCYYYCSDLRYFVSNFHPVILLHHYYRHHLIFIFLIRYETREWRRRRRRRYTHYLICFSSFLL